MARRRTVAVDERPGGSYRLRWRFRGEIQTVTLPSKAIAYSAATAIEESPVLCNIADDDDRIRTWSLWRPGLPPIEVEEATRDDVPFRDALISYNETSRANEQTRATRGHMLKAGNVFGSIASTSVRSFTVASLNAWTREALLTMKPSTVEQRRNLILGVLHHARAMGWSHERIVARMLVPVEVEPRGTYVTVDEFDDLIDALPMKYHAIVTLLPWTGLRIGEALALTVGDVNLDSGRITLRQGVSSSAPVTTAPGKLKTKKSRRTVKLPADALAAIRPLVVGRPRTAPLFVNPLTGHRWSQRSILAAFKLAAVEVGLSPELRLHDLRHSNASWLLNKGVHLFIVSKHLGHSGSHITDSLYGHLMEEGEDMIAEALDRSKVVPIRRKRATAS